MARAHGHRRERPDERVVDGLAAVAPILVAADSVGAGSTILALLLTLASVMLSLRLTGTSALVQSWGIAGSNARVGHVDTR